MFHRWTQTCPPSPFFYWLHTHGLNSEPSGMETFYFQKGILGSRSCRISLILSKKGKFLRNDDHQRPECQVHAHTYPHHLSPHLFVSVCHIYLLRVIPGLNSRAFPFICQMLPCQHSLPRAHACSRRSVWSTAALTCRRQLLRGVNMRPNQLAAAHLTTAPKLTRARGLSKLKQIQLTAVRLLDSVFSCRLSHIPSFSGETIVSDSLP